MKKKAPQKKVQKTKSSKISKLKKPLKPKPVNLALQGGGAHGAYTWGVLDQLLEDGRVEIEAISGTSAGAMNSVILADGLMKGGIEGARQALKSFWKAVSSAAQLSPIRRTPFDKLAGNWNLDRSPAYLFFDVLKRMVSPYQMNPMKINPLRDLLIDQIDFQHVKCCNRVKLFISATSVRTGRVKVFTTSEITPDVVMASACLPFLFQAVNIDGDDYWDGGFMGNPVLFPFAYHCTSPDVVIVQINPLGCQKTPTTANEIMNRVNEITFNASLMREFRAIDFVTKMINEGSLDPGRYKKMLIHIIHNEEDFDPLNASSKLNVEWDFLQHLFDIGRKTAMKWLDENYENLGRESTVDLRSLYM